MAQSDDEKWMALAIEASARAVEAGNRPFGATLVKDGKLLLVAENEQIVSGDCTDHAETVLVRRATAKLGAASLQGSTVYASGEPCAMCAGAMFWAGVGRIVFAASTQDISDCFGPPVLGAPCAEVLARSDPKPRIDGLLLRAEAVAVLRRAAQGSRGARN